MVEESTPYGSDRDKKTPAGSEAFTDTPNRRSGERVGESSSTATENMSGSNPVAGEPTHRPETHSEPAAEPISNPAPPGGLAGRFYPDGKISDRERVIWATGPTWWVEARKLIGGVLLGAAGIVLGLATLIWGGGIFDHFLPGSGRTVPTGWWVFPLGFLVAGGGLSGLAILKQKSTWYVLTDRRILTRKGMVRRRSPELSLTAVDSSDTRLFKPLHYFFNVGDIELSTPGAEGYTMKLEKVTHPKERAKDLKHYRELAQADSDAPEVQDRSHRLYN